VTVGVTLVMSYLGVEGLAAWQSGMDAMCVCVDLPGILAGRTGYPDTRLVAGVGDPLAMGELSEVIDDEEDLDGMVRHDLIDPDLLAVGPIAVLPDHLAD